MACESTAQAARWASADESYEMARLTNKNAVALHVPRLIFKVSFSPAPARWHLR
jgi:prephenate dehydratase